MCEKKDNVRWKTDRPIGVLTYSEKHRKTYDLLSLLKVRGYKNVIVYATPFHYQKKSYPLVTHRPVLISEIPNCREICVNFGYRYEEGDVSEVQTEPERLMLIAGAGLLPDQFIKKHIVINAHPGYIPNCRGLDALKWAIYEDQPIGVTTHLLGDYVDAGEVIERREISIYEFDSFHAVAQRVYENEVAMLADAVERYEQTKTSFYEPGNYELHRRIPNEIDKTLLERFEQYKKLRHCGLEYK